MHLKRLVIALILIPLFYIYVMYLPPEFFLFILTFFGTIALLEFYTMYRISGLLKYAGIFWGAAFLFVFFLARDLFADILLLSALTVMGIRLFAKRDPKASLSDISAAMLGLLYIPGLLTFQFSLIKEGPQWIVLLYASVWAADSMAYYAGTSIGKRKLYKEISPNKTVAGAAGSVIGGILGAALIKATILQQISLYQTILIGSVVGITTVIGDLVESMFKRDAGVKDSSNVVPGHGGVLDKLDGVTFAGPALYWLCLGLGLI
ncbi:MAG: phosphatidate cytidylyltransferase [Nitrospirota bacterium]